MTRAMTLEEKFWPKVQRVGECLEWTGYRDKGGYGHLVHKGKGLLAHRVAILLETGEFPDGLALHTCDNPPCVRFDHLYVGTAKENARDRVVRGRDGGHKRRGARSACRKGGHAWTPENTYTDPSGRRRCRTCFARWRDRKYGKASVGNV